ncbi:orotidine-5'-phosphate decarboxylase [bacterium]|nr:orotidine-5'-phosphate decarboxylase [bacterium]
MKNRDKVIVALDLDNAESALHLAESVATVFPFFKIGMKLFTREGPDFVREVLEHGQVFLDLKFYDIPTIVAEAVSNAGQLGVSLLTVHASGGSAMLRQCMEKLESSNASCRLLAVTVLTSFDSLEEFGIEHSIPDHVQRLAHLAHSSGVHGLVCSPQELVSLRAKYSTPFLLVTPGIRSASDFAGDQKRTASASEALKAGADYLVIGRPIIAAADPVKAAEKIAEEIS